MAYKFNPFTGNFDLTLTGPNKIILTDAYEANWWGKELPSILFVAEDTEEEANVMSVDATSNTENTRGISFMSGAQPLSGGTSNTGFIEMHTGENYNDNGNTGDMYFSTGNNEAIGNSGNIYMTTGTSTAGNSGDISLRTQAASGTQGSIILDAPITRIETPNVFVARNLQIMTDHPDGNWGSAGAAIVAVQATEGDYSALSLFTQDTTEDGAWTSDIRIKAGDASGAGAGSGGVTIEGGNAVDGPCTNLDIIGGSSTNANGGTVSMTAGSGGVNGGDANLLAGAGGSGNPGTVVIQAGTNLASVRGDVQVYGRALNIINDTLLCLGNIATVNLPVSASNGTMIYDITTNELMVWKNGSWRTVTTS